MRKSEIKLGSEYAIQYEGEIVRATVVRPSTAEQRWVALREGVDAASQRTFYPRSSWIIAPWRDYCIDSAHAEAISEDQHRRWRADYEAEREATRQARLPLIEAFRGISIPGAAVSTANFALPDHDLADWLTSTFVETGACGASVSFDVFEAIAKLLIEQREAIDRLLTQASGWAGDGVDTGQVEVTMTAEANTALAAIENVAAQLDNLDKREAAGVAPGDLDSQETE